MRSWLTRCYVRAYVLNSLQHGRAEYEDLATYAERNLSYYRRQLGDAAGNLGVFVMEIDSKPHWQQPVMWWRCGGGRNQSNTARPRRRLEAQPNGRFHLRHPQAVLMSGSEFPACPRPRKPWGGGRKRFESIGFGTTRGS